ncbi:hypothetical protein [Aquimarina agarilytica]|uniref:hypothetical protein n=1 Tax=Aquimarina agarilytica TaxID=1087449 RepID=UPI00028A34A2|nr:hypothetical protein [Aquimarina agarilytica]
MEEFRKGDRVKHIKGKAPSTTAENCQYLVLEYFINVAKQPTVRVQDLETGEQYFRDPNSLEKL